MPDDLLPDHVAVEGEAKRQGVSYMTADGGELPNQGEKRVVYKTAEGHHLCSLFQVADVRKPLLSVPSLTNSGHTVTFMAKGGTIVHPGNKKTVHFHKRGGVYVLDMFVPPFTRQGQ